jgi:hypothetical protein
MRIKIGKPILVPTCISIIFWMRPMSNGLFLVITHNSKLSSRGGFCRSDPQLGVGVCFATLAVTNALWVITRHALLTRANVCIR